jgi:hypothetical protein
LNDVLINNIFNPNSINNLRNSLLSQFNININNSNIDTNEDIIIALTDEEFNEITSISSKDIQKDTKCNICLDCFSESSQILKLNCGHYYDHICIENWLKKHSNKCPVCRVEVSKGHPINM